MSSWPRKIYLLFWVTLISLTCLAAVLLPRLLDSSREQGYRDIAGQGRPPLLSQPSSSSVSTRFPVRPWRDESGESEPPARQPFPSASETANDRPERPSGLPQRDVLADKPAAGNPAREAVTSRLRINQDASVYESPKTTARVLGTVAAGTQVRWLKSLEAGWEEILLNDGRSVYLQSHVLSFGGGSERPNAGAGASQAEIASLLPATVESYLASLRDGDLLRASTYLAAEAPPLEEPELGVWGALVGPDSDARIDRMEPVAERGADWRSVLVLDQTNGIHILTTWQWDLRQGRWLLANWQ